MKCPINLVYIFNDSVSIILYAYYKIIFLFSFIVVLSFVAGGQEDLLFEKIDRQSFDPATLLWYKKPAAKWEEALPVGNGRLGAMVYGTTAEERLQLNEDTYWTGGPYSNSYQRRKPVIG